MNKLFVVLALAGALAGCGNGSQCLPDRAATACGANVYIDASNTDPVCLNAAGAAVCRGNDDAVCYVCSGSFTDGCTITSSADVIECVHACSKC
jgi:hypothetical protein